MIVRQAATGRLHPKGAVPTIRQSMTTPSDRNAGFVQARFPVASEMAEASRPCRPRDLDTLRDDLMRHLKEIGLSDLGAVPSKPSIRDAHASQRDEARSRIVRALGPRRMQLYALHHLAEGRDVDPDHIRPEIELVDSDSESGDVFRFATLFWSVPVTLGYGRRMRFLVWDRQNDKLVGAIALCDPVFNLKKRDDWIGWDADQRRERLVHTMSAYVAGALPPYSHLLGGKLVTALAASTEVGQHFRGRYGSTTGTISGEQKDAHLALVTFTSALGRSSIYNRVRLLSADGVPAVDLRRLGYTQGYGHFQVPEELFQQLKALVESTDRRDWTAEMGTGPNWRIRVIRAGLRELGIDGDAVLQHGIRREIFALPVADNALPFLRGQAPTPDFSRQQSVAEISQLAVGRWMVPRARRRPEYSGVSRHSVVDNLLSACGEAPTASHLVQRPLLPLR